MAQLHLVLSDTEKQLFSEKVGYGNMSKVLLNFIKTYSDDKDLNETVLRRKLRFLAEEKEKLDNQYNNIKAKVEAIDFKLKVEEIERLEKEQAEIQKWSDIEHDTIKANLHRVV